ncbi:MAG: helix-turn-helix transcriptional regulator [Bryobacteraceae bacterium]
MRREGPCSSPDRIIFETDSVRIGAFRCRPCERSFEDSGPAQNYCFVFPRTAVVIQHEDERAFAANPNVVTFYNRHQSYRRTAISERGDYCDWFGVDADLARDVVRIFDPDVDDRPERPFRMSRSWSDPRIYLLQRHLFQQVDAAKISNPLIVEEQIMFLLEQVVRLAYRRSRPKLQGLTGRQHEAAHYVELLLGRQFPKPLHLRGIAKQAGMSVYHLCRTFRRATGMAMHQYRHRLRVRSALEPVCEPEKLPLTGIALDLGFSSHSHFTSAFHREFGETPSAPRARFLS